MKWVSFSFSFYCGTASNQEIESHMCMTMESVQVTFDWTAIHSLLPSHSGAITDVGFYLTPPRHLPPAPVSAADVWSEISTQVNVDLITTDLVSPIMPITARRWVLPLCCALIDSSPLTRFMGVRTFLSVTSNWSTAPLAGGPGPWLAATGQWKTKEPLWWIIYSIAVVFLWSFFLFFFLADQVCVQSIAEGKIPCMGHWEGKYPSMSRLAFIKQNHSALNKQMSESDWPSGCVTLLTCPAGS